MGCRCYHGERHLVRHLSQAVKGPPRLPPPKPAPPGHAESYNPPEEYLFNEDERKEWEDADEEERELNFLPQKYAALRKVPAYQNFVKERFERALDLYLCPRVMKKRLNINPDSLVPKLPSPEELRPYPTTVAVEYVGHEGRVRSVSVSSCGQWMLSGGDDGMVRLWEVQSGRLQKEWAIDVPAPAAAAAAAAVAADDDASSNPAAAATCAVLQVAFSPATPSVAACIVGPALIIFHTSLGNGEQQGATDRRLQSAAFCSMGCTSLARQSAYRKMIVTLTSSTTKLLYADTVAPAGCPSLTIAAFVFRTSDQMRAGCVK